jgi:hypothetical protein
MAKSKKKKKHKGKDQDKDKVELKSQKTVTILVPDVIGDLDQKVLHGIGRLTAAAVSTFKLDDVAIVKSSQLAEQILLVPTWHKSITLDS